MPDKMITPSSSFSTPFSHHCPSRHSIHTPPLFSSSIPHPRGRRAQLGANFAPSGASWHTRSSSKWVRPRIASLCASPRMPLGRISHHQLCSHEVEVVCVAPQGATLIINNTPSCVTSSHTPNPFVRATDACSPHCNWLLRPSWELRSGPPG